LKKDIVAIVEGLEPPRKLQGLAITPSNQPKNGDLLLNALFQKTPLQQFHIANIFMLGPRVYYDLLQVDGDNRSERLVYKRKRNKEAPGAFALCNGQLIDGWLETINDNFECTGSFGLWKFKDRKSLREENHMASSFSIPSQAISSWLGKSF